MKKFTKIVATISDRRCEVDFIRSLAEAGVNVVRMNSAHIEWEGFERIVSNVRQADPSLAIIMDTKGPEIRTTITEGDVPVTFHAGDIVSVTGTPDTPTTAKHISLNYDGIAKCLHPGDRMLIDDGELAFTITSVEGDLIIARAENDGVLGSRKSVNLPGVSVDLPAVTERDKRNIGYAVKLGVDFIAHSFVRTASDVAKVREILDELGSDAQIISKIENQEGIDNIDEILAASYGIMVARGDLGIEVAAERIPGMQTMIIDKCIKAHKPVIVATQMLHSMINHPRPTRAEISDVANAVYQRADATMLSGETAYGKYPLEAVRTMTAVAREVEESLRVKMYVPPLVDANITTFLAREAVKSEHIVGTKAIFTDSFRGQAARLISSFRGNNPTFAICHNQQVSRWLALSYGVKSFYYPAPPTGTDTEPRYSIPAVREIVEQGYLSPSDHIAYLTGTASGTRALEILTPAELFESEK